MDISTLEDETVLSQYKGNQLPADVGPHPQTKGTTLHLLYWSARN